MVNLCSALVQAIASTAQASRPVSSSIAAVLWTDKERQWLPILSRLQAELPQLLALGDYVPSQRTGPAIWLKCVIARTLGEVELPPEAVPILYLPGVGRADLRAVETCPRALQPLVELQYRGVFWSQANGKDWTVHAFLTARRGGLGLDVAEDRATQQALLRALDVLLDTPVERLNGKRLQADDFDHLLVADPMRDVLVWLNDPDAARSQWGAERWAAFVQRCRQDLGLHPEQDGAVTAAERLAGRDGAWRQVWERYAEAPGRYPRVLERLRRLGQPQDLFADAAAYPSANEAAEARLRQALLALAHLPPPQARQRLAELEREHGMRRLWLWAQMGLAPLAAALEHLSHLAAAAEESPGGTLADISAQYQARLWRIDAAALAALGCTHSQADATAVAAALRAVYVPWLEDCAHRLQAQVRQEGLPGGDAAPGEVTAAASAAGLCLVFVDGLRYDVAQRLAELLRDKGHEVSLAAAWTCVPSVTASGKPWVSPIAHRVTGSASDSDFEPSVKGEGKALNTHHFRRLLAEEGWQYLTSSESGDVSGKAWTEAGDLDHYGHHNGMKLARDMDRLVHPIAERIQELAQAGWRRIRVVTDHGWLLVPGGMPKVDLPKYMADTRWGRCALLKENAKTEFLTLGWGWAPEVPIAMAPGISSFIAGAEYAHGGVSLQESLIPVIDVKTQSSGPSKPTVEIKAIVWNGLRCRIEVHGNAFGVWADIRAKAADASSTLATTAKLVQDGKASLVVSNDEAEGQAAFVVLYDESGEVLAKQPTVIGE